MRIKFSLDYLIDTLKRFPLAALISVVTTIVALFLNHQEPITANEPFFKAAYVGFLLAVIAVIVYERFLNTRPKYISLLLQAVALAIAALVYFVAPETEEFWNTDYTIRINVILFFLLVCIVWLPTLQNATLTFGKHFVILFKSFFITVLFSAVLGAGLSLIVGAWDLLLAPVDSALYSDIYSIVLYLFAPLYMLSLQSPYTAPYKTEPNKVDDTIHRIFDIILTKISIPLITVLSLILLAYIVLNFTTISNNELETILISYVVFGWVFLFLIYSIDRSYVRWFKRGFLAALFIISAFQLIRSVQYAADFGITHNRYFVILFCLVSAVSVILYVRWPRFIPIAVMVALIISLIPPIDALSVGARSQTQVLTETVENNEELLVDGNLQATEQNVATVSSDDAQRIVESARYLADRNKLQELPFISEDFDAYEDLYELALRIETEEDPNSQGYYVSLNQIDPQVIEVSDNQHIVLFQIYTNDPEVAVQNFTVADHEFEARLTDSVTLLITDLTTDEDYTFDFSSFVESSEIEVSEFPLEDLTFNAESDSFDVRLIVEYYSVFEESSDGNFLLILTSK